MVDLASLVVRLVADASRFGRDLDRARQNLGSFAAQAGELAKKVGAAAGAAALAAAAGFAAMAKSAIDTADELNDLSKITGVSVESLSQLRFAAEQSGTDLEGLTAGIKSFNKQAAEAAGGNKAAAESFALIGVSVTDASGKLKPTEQLLLEVSEKFAMFKDGAGKTAAAMELLGKSGASLVPFLNNGAIGIRELMEEADRLGLTIRKSTAVAADEFNDKLNKINQQFSTVGIQIAEKFLPALLDIATALSEMLAKRTDIKGFLDMIADGFRAIAYVGVSVVDTFQDVGRLIGAIAAGRAQLLRGNIAEVKSIFAEYLSDAIDAEKKTTETLAKIWGERAETFKNTLGPKRLGSYLSAAQLDANKTRTGLEQPLKEFPIARAVKDELQEVEIRLKKIELPEDFDEEFEARTRTSLENAFKDFQEKKASLTLQQLEGRFDNDPALFIARLREIENEMLGVLTRGPRQAKEELEKLNEFQVQAARNTQDIIAGTFEGLVTGADISAKSILQSFGKMIVQLAAQAAAANIAGKLFGEAGGGTKGSTGWLGTLAGAFGFGGTRDSGGRGRPGMAYMIGKGAQPEMFVPDRAGTFMPAGAYGGNTTNNFTIVADEPLSRRTQLQIAAAASRGVERANRRNN